MKIIRSRAPFRIGFAGGGTDLESYYKYHSGDVFNASISLYAYSTLVTREDGKISFAAPDRNISLVVDESPVLEKEIDSLPLHIGVYNRVVKEFNKGKPLSFSLVTSADVPGGSGLGTSSTMVVSILEVFLRFLGIELSVSTKAQLAYDIERNDLALFGGKQDQYAACYGGFSHMQFKKDGSVIVNQLRLPSTTILELESSLFLFYTGRARDSATIIKEQINNTREKNEATINAMKNIQQAAIDIKDALLIQDFSKFKDILNTAWKEKKKTSNLVSNEGIDNLIEYIFSSGAKAVKLSGAGGGGFMLIYFDPSDRHKIQLAMKKLDGALYPVKFSKYGVESWCIER